MKKLYLIFSLILLGLLTACGVRLQNAPISERSSLFSAQSFDAVPPGYYRVKPKDTVYHIATVYQHSVQEIAAWNNMSDPSQLQTNQLLRVVPPHADVVNDAAPAQAIAVTDSRPVLSNAENTDRQPSAQSNTAQAVGVATTGKFIESKNLHFIWPTKGSILAQFDGNKNKGVDIGGQLGQPVVASESGKVVYAGQGLRGYGNLIIVKHNAIYLTAYAHNKALLAKEGQWVKKGQQIAEMGNSDSNRVVLHFEIRKSSKPVNPKQYLPAL